MGKSGPRNNAPGAARLVKEPIFGIHQTSISLDAGILFVELTTLRSATAIQHRDIEKDLDLLRPSFTRNQYIGLLKRFYGFHLPWELKVSAALETEFLTRHFNQQLAIRTDCCHRQWRSRMWRNCQGQVLVIARLWRFKSSHPNQRVDSPASAGLLEV